MSPLHSEDERLLALYPLPNDDPDNRTTWHWLPAVVLNVTTGRDGVEYAVVIEDDQVAEYDPTSDDPDEATYPVAFRDASELQPRQDEGVS